MSAPWAMASPNRNSLCRALLPPSNRPVQSSRLMKPAPCADFRGEPGRPLPAASAGGRAGPGAGGPPRRGRRPGRRAGWGMKKSSRVGYPAVRSSGFISTPGRHRPEGGTRAHHGRPSGVLVLPSLPLTIPKPIGLRHRRPDYPDSLAGVGREVVTAGHRNPHVTDGHHQRTPTRPPARDGPGDRRWAGGLAAAMLLARPGSP